MAELPMVIIMTNDHDDLGNNCNHDIDKDDNGNKIITNLRRLASWSSGMKEDSAKRP